LPENKLTSSLLKKNIEQSLLSFIENGIKYGSADSSTTFVLAFSHRDVLHDRIVNDSLIYISTLNCNDLIFKDGFVGIIKITGNTVAIFDQSSFGKILFNPSQLIDTPLIELKCNETKMRGVQSFILKNRELKKWK